MKTLSLWFFVRSLAMLLCAGTVHGAIRTVTSLVDGGSASLRDTIGAASSGDIIRFGITGTIILQLGTLEIDKDLTIEGPVAPANIILARSAAAGTPPFSIFTIAISPGHTVTLSGLTIRNGSRGGVNSTGGTLTVTNCRFEDNSNNDYGGAIFARPNGGSALISGCTFTGNMTYEMGGAVTAWGIGVTIENCSFTDNSSDDSGGAVFCNGATTVKKCTFDGNICDPHHLTAAGGGAVRVDGNSTVEDCHFTSNKAAHGGAIHLRSGLVRRCSFLDNEGSSGAAISCQASIGTGSVQNCTFSGNVSFGLGVEGRAILHTKGTLGIHSCTVYTGGELLQRSTEAQTVTYIANTILAGSIAKEGPGTIVSDGFNLCTGNGSGFLTGPNDQINTNPRFDPLGLRDNGGPTPTIALLGNSPALDRGHSGGLTTDQRGWQRPRDLPAYPVVAGGDHSDIGAVEAVEPNQDSPIIVNTLHDHDDGIASAADCTLREAIARANALAKVAVRGLASSTTIGFHPGLSGNIALDPALGPLNVINYSYTNTITITGPGARLLAVSAGGHGRVLDVARGGPAGPVSISGLTIRDGEAVPATPGAAVVGGGIRNEGSLTLLDCTLTDNIVRGADATDPGVSGTAAEGGGIHNAGTLTLRGCTFRNCRVEGGRGTDISGLLTTGGHGGNAAGGAIFNNGDSRSLTIENCTFSGNRAIGGDGGDGHFGGDGGHGHGAAVYNASGYVSITGATVAGNNGLSGFAGSGSSPANNGVRRGGSGGMASFGPDSSFIARNTLCAANVTTAGVPSDIFGAFVSEGYNLIGSADGSGAGFTHATDLTGTVAAPLFANVGPLQDNGGQCDTMLPTSANAGLDKGKSFGLTSDQRGLRRPLDAPNLPNAAGGDGSEIGAVEVEMVQLGPVFVVNTLGDHDDGVAGIHDATLREVINVVIVGGGAKTITFRDGLSGTITLEASLGNLTVFDSTTIIGPGARRLAISGNSQTRIFRVTGGTNAISGLTIRDGTVTGAVPHLTVPGGAILNESILVLTDCTLRNNSATGGVSSVGGDTGGDALGGAIANAAGGMLTAQRCAFYANTAHGGRGALNPGFGNTGGAGGPGRGGAIFNEDGATLRLSNCSLFDNSATGGAGAAGTFGGDGGGASGGAISNQGDMMVTALTVNDNHATGGTGGLTPNPINNGRVPAGRGGGIAAFSDATNNTVANTICAGNTGGGLGGLDVEGAFTSRGYNLIGSGDRSSGFTAEGDQAGTNAALLDPGLGFRGNNGGPTDTIALLPGSPALDSGKAFALSIDQRGLLRPYDDPAIANAAGGDSSDIGAFELRPPYNGPPEFILIERTSAGQRLCVQGSPFTPYQLQRSDEAGAGTFANLGTPQNSDGLGLVEFIDPAPLPPRSLYRVTATP